MFDMKRPCATCPFRAGNGRSFQMPAGRLSGILLGPAFQCHKTVDYAAPKAKRAGSNPQQCAGLMALLRAEGCENQIMQLAERLTGETFEGLDKDAEAYQTFEAMLADHGVDPGDAKMIASAIRITNRRN